MPRYYVNKRPGKNGKHKVHRFGCSWMPESENRLFVGNHARVDLALIRACMRLKKATAGCRFCRS